METQDLTQEIMRFSHGKKGRERKGREKRKGEMGEEGKGSAFVSVLPALLNNLQE